MLIHGGFWRARYDLRLEDRLVADLAGRGWAAWNLEYRRLGGAAAAAGRRRSRTSLPGSIAAGSTSRSTWRASSRSAIPRGASRPLGRRALRARRRPGADPRIRLAGAVAQAGVIDLREAARLGLSTRAAESLLGGSPIKLPARYDLASPIERRHSASLSWSCKATPTTSSRYRSPAATPSVPPPRAIRVSSPSSGCGHDEHLDPDSEAWRAVTAWLERQ